MLTGQELGAAIDAARIIKKLSKKALAEHFRIAPPSVQGWIKTGRIDKSKLIEVIDFFSDVVGPEHWGLSERSAANLFSPRYEEIAQAAEADISGIALSGAEIREKNKNYGEVQGTAIASNNGAADKVRKMLEMVGKSLPEEVRQQIIRAASEGDVQGGSNVITGDFRRASLAGDEIRIAHYDVQGAMGTGKLVHDFPEMFRDVTVSQQHLKELGVTYKDPAHLKLITGDGQSMEPTIQDKDPLIADASIREFSGDGIYAFVWQGLFYIKRLQIKDSDHFKMISDNKHHDPEIIRIDETYIQARILLVWNAQKL